jgi:hypothetical protein
MFNNFSPENRAVYKLIWKKYSRAGQATDDNIIRRMRFACWVTKATNKHSECVIISAFPRQQWLCESASMLRLYILYVSCLRILYARFEVLTAVLPKIQVFWDIALFRQVVTDVSENRSTIFVYRIMRSKYLY